MRGQNDDCRRFLALFDREFFAGGVVGFDESNAEPVLRACAAIRLRLREGELRDLPDETLESGNVDVSQFAPRLQKAFMCYVFLATVQELIIQHLDSALLEGCRSRGGGAHPVGARMLPEKSYRLPLDRLGP